MEYYTLPALPPGAAGYEHIRVSEFQPDDGATVKERIHVRTSDHRCRRVRMEMPS